jgi:hypothetical protein
LLKHGFGKPEYERKIREQKNEKPDSANEVKTKPTAHRIPVGYALYLLK